MCKKNIPHCEQCGTAVTSRGKGKTRSGKRSDKIFCNRQCYDKYRAAKVDAREFTCKNCGSSFKKPSAANYLYCSHECRVADKKPKPVYCLNCSVKFTGVKVMNRNGAFRLAIVNSRKTCSRECEIDWIKNNESRKKKISLAFRAEKHPNWQGGSHYGKTRGPGWQRIAEQCREAYGRKCARCNMDEADGIARGWGRLQVNHIKPFWQWQNKTKANHKSNLEALCKSCHTKTDWEWRKANPVQQSLDIFR